jgi:hypothetical protein
MGLLYGRAGRLTTKWPARAVIKQGFHGGNDMGDWEDAATALVGMGASALSAPPSEGVSQIFRSVGVTAAGYGWTLSILSASDSVDHAWGRTDAEVAANVALWAEKLVGSMRAAGFTKLTQFALHDELRWSFAAVGVGPHSGPNNITGNPRVFQRFHGYIRNMSGLTTPVDFGADSWSAVVPITRDNATAARGGANEQGMRTRFYWTMRFVAWDVESWYARATAALVTANKGESFSIYTNTNNFHGRLYTPGCAGPPAPTADCKADSGSMDWFEAGRLRAGTMLWVSLTTRLLSAASVFLTFLCDHLHRQRIGLEIRRHPRWQH